MNLGFATETTKDSALDPLTEFREGVELLKNEYPPKALVRLRCVRKRQAKCLLHFVSWVVHRACATEVGSSLGPLRNGGTTKT